MEEKQYHRVNAKIYANYGIGSDENNVTFSVDNLKVELDDDGEVTQRDIMLAFNDLVRLATSTYGREAGTIFMEVDNPVHGAHIINLNRINYFGLEDWFDTGEWKEGK